MYMKEYDSRLYPHDRFPLSHCRREEIKTVLSCLDEVPAAFVWAPAGNGKTGFAREFCKDSGLSTEVMVGTEYPDKPVGAEIIVMDGFDLSPSSPELTVKKIETAIDNGKRFIFLVHNDKSAYVDWRSRHKRQLPHITSLISKYPTAAWLYLRKFRAV